MQQVGCVAHWNAGLGERTRIFGCVMPRGFCRVRGGVTRVLDRGSASSNITKPRHINTDNPHHNVTEWLIGADRNKRLGHGHDFADAAFLVQSTRHRYPQIRWRAARRCPGLHKSADVTVGRFLVKIAW